jgi:hypothetical protein
VSLRQLMRLIQPHLSRAAWRMWAAEPAIDRYREWLRTSYDLVRATAPLLAEAVSASVRHGEGDLARYYAGQLIEEYGHDQWIEEDWAAAGGDPAELASRIPRPAVAKLVGAQYYWLRHTHPIALAGHIAMLEWHPPDPGVVASLMNRTGLPEHAFRTITRHIDIDAEHGPPLENLLARLPHGDARQHMVSTSALTTAHALVELMTELGEERYDESITPRADGVQPPVRHRG